jgi:Zn-dependent peptidase ImmA (M78 family)
MKYLTLQEYKKKYKKTWNIPDEMEAVKVPDYEFKEKEFWDADCAKVIWKNISPRYKRMLTPHKVLNIVSLQQEYIISKQKRKKYFVAWDTNNIRWMEKKIGLSFDVFHQVAEYEGVYLKLIGCMND